MIILKKTFNWLGLLLNFIYFGVIIFSIAFGVKMQENQNIDLRNIFFAIATTFFVASFALIPVIWDRALGFLLPIKKSYAVLAGKNFNELYVRHGAKRRVTTKYFLTFEFTDGHRKTFCVNPSSSRYDIFFSVLQYESGMLCYKEQGRNMYFISFTPDVTGQPIS